MIIELTPRGARKDMLEFLTDVKDGLTAILFLVFEAIFSNFTKVGYAILIASLVPLSIGLAALGVALADPTFEWVYATGYESIFRLPSDLHGSTLTAIALLVIGLNMLRAVIFELPNPEPIPVSISGSLRG